MFTKFSKYGSSQLRFIFPYFTRLFHLPPLRFRCVGECWDWTRDSCGFGSGVSRSSHSDLDLIHLNSIVVLLQQVGLGPACAPVRCAHPSFELIATTKRGASRPPSPPIAASLLLIWPPKIHKIYPTWAAHVEDFFLSTGPQRLYMRSPAPRPTHRSFADPSGNILGSKVYTGATIRTNFFRFFFSLVLWNKHWVKVH